MHYVAVVMFPALVYLLWTMHYEQRESAAQDLSAQTKRMKLLIAIFVMLGLAGYVYVKGWKGWISVLPILPEYVPDGYSLLSVKHLVDLFNLLLWAVGAGVAALFATHKLSGSIKLNNQENFLFLAASASAVFAAVFSPNLGMARDWDIVSAALWPTAFYAAWRISKFEYEVEQLLKLRASLLALVVLILVPAVLVQSQEGSALARYQNLLVLDHSRSAYGWENLALHYQRSGELDKRIDAWEHAVDAERNPRYLFNLAEAYKLADRMDEADTVAIAAAELNKEFASNLFYYAVAQAKRDRLDRTRVLVNTALELDSTIAFGTKMKWWADKAFEVDSIAKAGDTETARFLVSQYAQLDSTNSYWREYGMKLGR
jgi:tetratricopeptide (TPR) repeat protein